MRRRAAMAAACCLALGIAGATSPALAALTRSLVQLDGDAAVRSAASEDLLLTQSRPGTTTTEFGSAVAFGDVNGDGLADAVVGQRTQNKVFVYLGSAAPRSAGWFDDPNLADIIIEAPGGTADKIQQFGFSVAVFDLDLDLRADILVGAPFSDPNGKTDSGLAFAILGNGQLGPGQSFTLAQAPALGIDVVKLTRGGAAKAGDHLGFAVAAGLLPSIGNTFLAVSARDADAVSPAPRTDAGAVHVALGLGPHGLTAGVFDLDTRSALTMYGADASDALGESIATCGLDGAGDADLIVGAIFGDGPGNVGINRGEVLVLLGSNIASGFHAGNQFSTVADMTIYGSDNGDDLGYTVACGDLNDDGLDDLVASALFADSVGEGRPSAGEAYVLRGRVSQPDPLTPGRRELVDPMTSSPQQPVDLETVSDPNDPAPDAVDVALLGATTADELGFSLGVGDLDGDGVGDLVAGARRYDRDQTLVNVGATYMLLGSTGFLNPVAAGEKRSIDLHLGTERALDPNVSGDVHHEPERVDGIVLGASRDDHSSWAVATGDMNGDGADELMISAIGDLARAPGFRGEAYVLSFADIDGDSASDLIDIDNDNDGVSDEDEVAGTYTGTVPTDPLDQDTDNDGIQDGTELGFTCQFDGGTVEVACDDPNVPFTAIDPNQPPFFNPDQDPNTVTVPLDEDSDDDGLADGAEDANATGRVEGAESDASKFDTDGDLIFDGTELGVTTALSDTNLGANHFRADADGGLSRTNPRLADTDLDDIPDGVEDADRNGAVAGDANTNHVVDATEIWTETDAADADTDGDFISDGREDKNHNRVVDPGEANPLDQDTDDDGLPDGWIEGANGGMMAGVHEPLEGEDLDGDGVFGAADSESSPEFGDTDLDGLPDGTEIGLPMGAGVNGANGTPDAGPGGDGTNPASAYLVVDAAPTEPNTFPWDADTDDDGLADGFIDDTNHNGGGQQGGVLDGMGSAYEGEDFNLNGKADAGETFPRNSDSDGDGVRDGVERGVTAAERLKGRDQTDDPLSGPVQDGTGGAGLLFDVDQTTVTDALDADSDDDGLSESAEDSDGNGRVDTAETDPNDFDSDDDMLPDGLERGVVMPDVDTNLAAMRFIVDEDPLTMTDPRLADTDAGGANDGDEDALRNGKVDATERDPRVRGDDDRTGVLEFTDTLNGTTTTTPVVPGAPLFVRLDDDAAKNADPNVAETLTISCASSRPDAENVLLTAVDPNSGVFAGTLPTNNTDPNIPGELTVVSGDSITCTYVDPLDAVDTRTAMLTALLTPPPVIPEFDVRLPAAGSIEWTPAGPSSLQPGTLRWNLYRGDMSLLRSTGTYTQVALGCGLTSPQFADTTGPPSGKVFFYLAAGALPGLEGPLGSDSSGRARPSTRPCGT